MKLGSFGVKKYKLSGTNLLPFWKVLMSLDKAECDKHNTGHITTFYYETNSHKKLLLLLIKRLCTHDTKNGTFNGNCVTV